MSDGRGDDDLSRPLQGSGGIDAPPEFVQGDAPGQKGLKTGALGLMASTVIGVASTAPGYSLAATLGFVIAICGVQAPAIMLVAFFPMAAIAAGYYYLNRADPDCGTTFSWGTRAFGPHLGWLGGWAIIVADIIVMANLAAIAGIYSYLLFGADGLAESTFWVTALGVLFIAAMTWICYIGIEVSARTQYFLLGMEIAALTLFAAVALWKVGFDDPSGALTPELSWMNPFSLGWDQLVEGILLAIFIYWGWDSAVAVNEESSDATRNPGKAAVLSTVCLVLIYVIVSIAAIAFGGVEALADVDDVLAVLAGDVLGSPWDKILIIAVLTSSAASCQTTILPTARTSLSMAAKGAAPKYWGRINPKGLTPSTSTIWMGALSIVWYVALTIISENILFDSLLALGLMIAFYYGLTGLACVFYYRRQLSRSTKNLVMMGLLPGLGALTLFGVLVKSVIDLSDPENSESGDSWLGLGPPLVIAIVFAVLGVVLMLLQKHNAPEFFRRKPETATDAIAAGDAVAEGTLFIPE